MSLDIKQSVNQNVFILIVSLSALGAADYFKLSCWFWTIGLILSIVSSISVIVSLYAYTDDYYKNKMGKK